MSHTSVTIALPYVSGRGHTKKLADLIIAGIEEVPGASAKALLVTNLTDDDREFILTADGILFGSPTYMGSIAADFKAFMEAFSGISWVSQRLANKVAGGFTVGTYPSGDKLATLQQLAVFAAQHSMIWVGGDQIGSRVTGDAELINDDGVFMGLAASSSKDKSLLIDPHYQETARRFGERFAKATQRWHSGGAIE